MTVKNIGLAELHLFYYIIDGMQGNIKKNHSKKWLWVLFHKRALFIYLMVAQISVFIYLVFTRSAVSHTVHQILVLVSFIVALHVISLKEKGGFKLTWVFMILAFPVLGGLMYLFFKLQIGGRLFSQRIKKISKRTCCHYLSGESNYSKALEVIPEFTSQISYLQNFAGFPIYENCYEKYLSPGEKKLEKLLPELQKAKKYIFMEYFIISDGTMWDQILEILKEKAAQGVKVRIIYDDIGCFVTLPGDMPRQLKKYGIECAVFNPFIPFLTVTQNNRDHRKIVVIDGKVAFTGGINIADEYINAKERFGHWKDAAIMIKGPGVHSFVIMFLQMWELCTGITEDYTEYITGNVNKTFNGSFIQPYADSPLDNENVGEHVYLQIINAAKDYLYIYTPYLILDDSLISALSLTAKSGVDVRIITPFRYDKKMVHLTTRSYYRELIKAGVRIFEYSKGFLHAKAFVADDKVATVGTTNLDFRSLYLHFECGVCVYNSSLIDDLKKDFLETQAICREIRPEDCKTNFIMGFFQDVLRLFAPLM